MKKRVLFIMLTLLFLFTEGILTWGDEEYAGEGYSLMYVAENGEAAITGYSVDTKENWQHVENDDLFIQIPSYIVSAKFWGGF